MAPTNFKIYVDPGTEGRQSQPPSTGFLNQPAHQPAPSYYNPPQKQTLAQKAPLNPIGNDGGGDQEYRFMLDKLAPNQRWFFDERKLYPVDMEEVCFEELNYVRWRKMRDEALAKQRYEELQRENDELRMRVDALTFQLNQAMEAQRLMASQVQQAPRHEAEPDAEPEDMTIDVQAPSPLTKNRLSVVPQSLQPAQCMDTDMSLYKEINDGTSVLGDLWRHTMAPHDKFTVPIDQSQYIKDNVPTSTPNNKKSSNEEPRRSIPTNVRRFSRPNAGSPTLKLSPITETSRDGNSKSSSSSSSTPSTVRKIQPLKVVMDEIPERLLDPRDPTTYERLLKLVCDPVHHRNGYFQQNRPLPNIRKGACFSAGDDQYLIEKELSAEDGLFTAQLLNEDSNDTSSMELQIKIVCIRVDKPANEWLFYIADELHRRLARLKTKPDIELSVMMANPAVMYNDGSIVVDEFIRYITLEQFFAACQESGIQFPKSVAAYMALELIQLVRQLHACEIIHMDIKPKNLVITCCPNRDDISSVEDRTSCIKLINFYRAMDTRLLPADFKFETKLDDLTCCQMIDGKPWSFELDWFGVLGCIHKMLFNTDMHVAKVNDRWTIGETQFKNLPTDIWESLFDGLLNLDQTVVDVNDVVNPAINDLLPWCKANLQHVLKEILELDNMVQKHYKLANKSATMSKV